MKCWPARYGTGRDSRRRNVFARAVSRLTSSTVALCQGPGAGAGATLGDVAGIIEAVTGSVTLVPLLEPGVTPVVVAVDLPEARLVMVQQPQAGHPLGALPEVQVRHEQPGRAAVLDRQ